jgi:hypothetical protein
MPKNKVSDPMTDQEMAFAHRVLSGTMTDRRAAEAEGVNLESAACSFFTEGFSDAELGKARFSPEKPNFM